VESSFRHKRLELRIVLPHRRMSIGSSSRKLKASVKTSKKPTSSRLRIPISSRWGSQVMSRSAGFLEEL
jgi:hypothetical protein